jgi:hypothetical protein
MLGSKGTLDLVVRSCFIIAPDLSSKGLRVSSLGVVANRPLTICRGRVAYCPRLFQEAVLTVSGTNRGSGLTFGCGMI